MALKTRTITKIIRTAKIGAGVYAALWVFTMAFGYGNHTEPGFVSVSRPHHVLSTRELIHLYAPENPPHDILIHYNILLGSSRTFVDGGPSSDYAGDANSEHCWDYDGLVDEIYITGGYLSGDLERILIREQDYERYQRLFDKSDKLLQAMKQRFKGLLMPERTRQAYGDTAPRPSPSPSFSNL